MPRPKAALITRWIEDKSTAYGKFEVDNSWYMGDGSCASTAVELGMPVLGGEPGDWEDVDPDVTFRVKVMEKRMLPTEEIKSVLSIPVSRKGERNPIGVINFDDVAPLNKSRLTNPAILAAAREVASKWTDVVR